MSATFSQAQEMLMEMCKEDGLSLREAALSSDLRKVRHSIALPALCSDFTL